MISGGQGTGGGVCSMMPRSSEGDRGRGGKSLLVREGFYGVIIVSLFWLKSALGVWHANYENEEMKF